MHTNLLYVNMFKKETNFLLLKINFILIPQIESVCNSNPEKITYQKSMCYTSTYFDFPFSLRVHTIIIIIVHSTPSLALRCRALSFSLPSDISVAFIVTANMDDFPTTVAPEFCCCNKKSCLLFT